MATERKHSVHSAEPAAPAGAGGRLREAAIPFSVALVLLVCTAVVVWTRGHTGLHWVVPLGLGLTVLLAYLTGTNSVAEGVATLVGSGVSGYGRALAWGSLWTLVGAVAAAILSAAIVRTIAGDLISHRVHFTVLFVLAVLLGTIIWMTAVTRLKMPVSMTHALAGSFILVAAVAHGLSAVRWPAVMFKVVVPIVASPLVAIILALLAYWVATRVTGDGEEERWRPLHWITSAAASFARGLNEAPKIAALGTLLLALDGRGSRVSAPFWLFVLVAGALAAGSFLGGRRVTKTLAEDMTSMNEVEAVSANFVTAVVVGVSSNLGLPVSTAEVGSGSIAGVGLRRGPSNLDWSVLRGMALAWVVTAPLAGLIALGAFAVLHLVQ